MPAAVKGNGRVNTTLVNTTLVAGEWVNLEVPVFVESPGAKSAAVRRKALSRCLVQEAFKIIRLETSRSSNSHVF